MANDGSVSFYFFDIDDNLLFLPTRIYLWNAEKQEELPIDSGMYAKIGAKLGQQGEWQAWVTRPESFRDFGDQPGLVVEDQIFLRHLSEAIKTPGWQGPAFPLLVHAAAKQRPTAYVTARAHAPQTIEAGLKFLVRAGHLPSLPPILGIYSVTNAQVKAELGAGDPKLSVPDVKKIAIKDAVRRALELHGAAPLHRFGMSDDDPKNVVLAISAMRDCKLLHPDKRFFVINTHHGEYVKLEVFPMEHPVTKPLAPILSAHDVPIASGGSASIRGGNAAIYIKNMDQAVAFYTTVMGFPLMVRFGNDWAEVDAGNGLVLGLHPEQPLGARAGAVGAVSVELAVRSTLEAAMAELGDRGVQFGEIQNYPNVRLVTFNDPDGNPLILSQDLNADP